MRRTLLLLLIAAACGGSHKSTTPPPPLPEAKNETPPPEPKPEAKPEKPAEPAEPPAGPIDVTVAAPKFQVKLLNAGKGKKAPLKVSAKQGDKQQVELAVDFTGKQAAPPPAGTQEMVYPTLVFTGTAEVKSIDKDGAATYEVTVSGTDARENQGQQIPTAVMKQAVDLVKDMKIGGTIAANGVTGDVKLHVDKGDRAARSVMELVRGATLPWWPVLPAEPIGVGAKWQVTATTKVSDKLDVTQTTEYELVDHKANKWTLKGTTKVAGGAQEVDGAKIAEIKGTGTIEVAMADGALYPTLKSQIETEFDAKVSDPDNKDAKPIDIHFDLKQGTAVTTK